MEARRFAIGLLALVTLLAAVNGAGTTRAWGFDLDFRPECTRLVLTAASVRLAFNFERDCSKLNSMRVGLS